MGRDAHHTVSVGKYFRQVLMVLSLSRATCDPINQAMPAIDVLKPLTNLRHFLSPF